MSFETISSFVCGDCLMAIANGDYTGLDYYYSPDEADLRVEEINAGISRLSEENGYIMTGDGENDLTLSYKPCDCCGADLDGERHEVLQFES